MTELLAGINPACDPWATRIFYVAIFANHLKKVNSDPELNPKLHAFL